MSTLIAIGAGIAVLAGIGAGIGITIRNQYIKAQNAKPDYTASSLVVQDMAGILETETSADAAGGETSADEANAEETAQAAETEAAKVAPPPPPARNPLRLPAPATKAPCTSRAVRA